MIQVEACILRKNLQNSKINATNLISFISEIFNINRKSSNLLRFAF